MVFFERASLLAIARKFLHGRCFAESLSRGGSLAKFYGDGAVVNGAGVSSRTASDSTSPVSEQPVMGWANFAFSLELQEWGRLLTQEETHGTDWPAR
jgi:hypothetical protein